jgi:hypothetical protein
MTSSHSPSWRLVPTGKSFPTFTPEEQGLTGRFAANSGLLEKRVKVEGVLVNLAQLATVMALAQQLLQCGQELDAMV